MVCPFVARERYFCADRSSLARFRLANAVGLARRPTIAIRARIDVTYRLDTHAVPFPSHFPRPTDSTPPPKWRRREKRHDERETDDVYLFFLRYFTTRLAVDGVSCTRRVPTLYRSARARAHTRTWKSWRNSSPSLGVAEKKYGLRPWTDLEKPTPCILLLLSLSLQSTWPRRRSADVKS